MATLYDRCRPREWMWLAAADVEWLIRYESPPTLFTNIPADDYREHWQLEGPRAPEEVK